MNPLNRQTSIRDFERFRDADWLSDHIMTTDDFPKITPDELNELGELAVQVNRYLRLGCWGDLSVSSRKLARKATKVYERIWKEQNKNCLKKTHA